ncbi:Protein of unknown function, partial [Gryllus bimaculatus]
MLFRARCNHRRCSRGAEGQGTCTGPVGPRTTCEGRLPGVVQCGCGCGCGRSPADCRGAVCGGEGSCVGRSSGMYWCLVFGLCMSVVAWVAWVVKSSSPAAKKTSTSEAPREACPTDSVTSSYGVGPTDEHGRPLFGLKALRRQNTGTNTQPPSGEPRAPLAHLLLGTNTRPPSGEPCVPLAHLFLGTNTRSPAVEPCVPLAY